MAIENSHGRRRLRRRAACGRALLGLGLLVVTSGCQTLVPTALPTSLGVGENAKIAKQAKADSFPSPADVGLATATSDSELR